MKGVLQILRRRLSNLLRSSLTLTRQEQQALLAICLLFLLGLLARYWDSVFRLH